MIMSYDIDSISMCSCGNFAATSNKIEPVMNVGLNSYNRKNCNMCMYWQFVVDQYQCTGDKNANAEHCLSFKAKDSDTFANIFGRLL